MNTPNIAAAPRPSIATTPARRRKPLVAVAVAAAGCLLSACSGVSGTETDSTPKGATVSASQDDQSAEEAAPDDVDDTEGDTFTVDLDKTATWNNGVKAHLGSFGRGTSGEYASPSGKAYLSFSVTVRNGSKSALDLSMISLSCPEGAEQVYDTDAGFGGAPDTHLLPGKSGTWKAACVFPKTAKDAQIEITPADTSDSGWYRTAIFTGQVK
ncbi:hypothetical protein [Streptomyces sp. RK62]|uniref:hypothetical protein n=1 Tax=Streptomyces sp. RK62 TaxID=2824893 RepID=UPI001B35DCF3|nr:hypothetical protein [Streptomyces sp. RK62]MBQ0995039.1 hypothetical protein [Streptomyces sp. RK62]